MPIRLLIATVVLLFLAGCSEPPYTNIDNQRLQDLLEQGVLLLDVRRPEEWRQTGVVEGSRGLTFVDKHGRVMPGFLERLSRTVDSQQAVALICRTGNRTDVLARHMVESLGYTEVYNVRDGITGWISEGKPVTRAKPATLEPKVPPARRPITHETKVPFRLVTHLA